MKNRQIVNMLTMWPQPWESSSRGGLDPTSRHSAHRDHGAAHELHRMYLFSLLYTLLAFCHRAQPPLGHERVDTKKYAHNQTRALMHSAELTYCDSCLGALAVHAAKSHVAPLTHRQWVYRNHLMPTITKGIASRQTSKPPKCRRKHAAC